jgi:hypothetical protein
VLLACIAWLVLRGTSIWAPRATLADALTLFVRQTDTASRTSTQHPDGLAIAAAYVCAHLNDVWLSALARAVSAHPQALARAGEVLRQRVAAGFGERRSSSQNPEAEPALRELFTALFAAGVLRSGGVDDPAPA